MNLKVQNISFGYSKKKVLKELSFEAFSGDMVAIIGQNGSGKSTLLKCIARLLKIQTGEIRLDGIRLASIPMDKISRYLAYMPQMEVGESEANVFETVLLGRKPYINQHPSEKDLNVVTHILSQLELEKMALTRLNTLSGGQRQRVLIARALAQEPSLFLLDEPISNLDLSQQLRVMRLLQGLAQKGMTIIMTLHDINFAARFCNKVLMLKAGEIFASGIESVYTPENIAQLYDVEVEVLYHKNQIYIIPYG